MDRTICTYGGSALPRQCLFHPCVGSEAGGYSTSHLTDPFLAPATRPTGPVEVPVAVDASAKTKAVNQKEKKKSHKSRKEKHSDKSVKTDQKVASSDPKSGKKHVSSKSQKKRDRSASPAP